MTAERSEVHVSLITPAHRAGEELVVQGRGRVVLARGQEVDRFLREHEPHARPLRGGCRIAYSPVFSVWGLAWLLAGACSLASFAESSEQSCPTFSISWSNSGAAQRGRPGA